MNQRKFRFWYLLTFMLGFSEGLVGTFFPLIFLEKGGTPFQLGFFVGIISLIGSIQLIWGYLLDKKPKPKRLAMTALGTNTIAAVSMAIPGTAILYGSGRTINGLGNSMYSNADYYLRTAYFPTEKRGRVGSNFMGINLFGAGSAIMLSGIIYSINGYSFSWFIHSIAAIFFVLSLVVYFLAIPEYNEKYVHDEKFAIHTVDQSQNLQYNLHDKFKLARQSKGLITYIISLLVFNFGVSLTGPYFIVELQNSWDFQSSQLSFLMSFNTFVQVVVIFALIPIIDIFSRKKIMTFGVVLATIPTIGLSIQPQFIDQISVPRMTFWIVIFLISSIGWGIVNSTLLTLLIDYVDPKIRGTVIATYGSLVSILSFFSALAAGYLIQYIFTSSHHLFILSTFIRIAGVILLFIAPSPPIPFADFYEQQQLFFTRLRASFERIIVYIPMSNKIRIKN